MQDKKVIYGVLGGAAVVVGTAILYHYFFGDKEGSEVEDEIDQIGALQRDAVGHIEFDQFIKIFELSSKHAKNEFAEKKKAFIMERRQVISDKEAYKKIVIRMTQQEEEIINNKLQEIMEKLQITEQEFQKNAMHHAQDSEKQMRMMQIQKSQQSASGGKVLSRDKAFECFRIQQDIQMQQMQKMMSDPSMMNMNQMTQEGQMEMMMMAMIEQCRAQDQLFEKTGVEEEQLLYSIEQLKLENDMEFVKIAKESQAKAMAMAQQAQGAMGGGGGFGQPSPMGMF